MGSHGLQYRVGLKPAVILLGVLIGCCFGESPLAPLSPENDDFSIHVVNADMGMVNDMDLLPLAGSYEHIQSRAAREKEEKRYFDSSEASDEAVLEFERAMLLKDSPALKSQTQMFRYLDKAASMNHVEAQELVALESLMGRYMKVNLSRARELFRDVKEKAHPSGQMGMGFFYSTGLDGEAASQPMALLHYMFAALGGNTYAQMALGYRYLYGINVENKCEQALHFYRKVASKVVDHVPVTGGPSMQKIRLYEEWENPGVNTNLDDDLVQYYAFIADKGDISAQVILGQLYLQGGRGMIQDRLLALSYFRKAADAGSANAAAFLGKMYLEGSPEVAQNNQTAYRYFKQAADQGNAMGQSGLGLVFLYGRGVHTDLKQALRYFKLSAEQSYVDGQAQLGIMLFHGLGVERDLVKSVKLLNQASQSGSVLALFYLAEINAFGFGVARSCRTATELYKNVAERGRWATLFMEAFLEYKKGHLNDALIKYLFLAELGYEVAQSNVAFLLDKAQNTLFASNETFRRAIIYWERAAAQGYHVARIKLGDYYYYGTGTDVDYEAAVSNYRQAEVSNSAQALFNLGYMYQQGLGVKQDLHLAKRYYDRAAELSVDAHTPVALALMGVGLIYAWQQFSAFFNNATMTTSLMDTVMESAVENWDLYLAGGLACILISALMIMQRINYELSRQRQRRRNIAQVPPLNVQPPPIPQPPAADDVPVQNPIPDPVQRPQPPQAPF